MRDMWCDGRKQSQQSLKMSGVHLVSSPEEADIVLAILSDDTSQQLLSIGGTQQTRQYQLKAVVTFEINDAKGRTLLNAQSLSEERVITMQSDQILGSSNEVNMLYQQMRRAIAYAIMNRLASKEVTRIINKAFTQKATTTKP